MPLNLRQEMNLMGGMPAAVVQKIAHGDLTVRVQGRDRDTASVKAAMKNMWRNCRKSFPRCAFLLIF